MMTLFSLYLRRGIVVGERTIRSGETKFNPNHDPSDGRFTFAPGRGALAPKKTAAKPVGQTTPRPSSRASGDRNSVSTSRQSATSAASSAELGGLSATYESGGGGDPGSISSGRNDPGGVSYGKYQFSSAKGVTIAFVGSPEASKWNSNFRGLTPGTPEFDAVWQKVALSDRVTFAAAQDKFVGRVHYKTTVNKVLKATSLDLGARGNALRQVTYSVGVQHGGAASILAGAVKQADSRTKRTDPGYNLVLINAIYAERSAYVRKLRDAARARGDKGTAAVFENILTNRYPNERADALQLLAKEG